MHYIDIHPLDHNGDPVIAGAVVNESGLTLGHAGDQMIKVHPQVEGVGYGLTITDLDGKTLLTIDTDGVVTHYRGGKKI